MTWWFTPLMWAIMAVFTVLMIELETVTDPFKWFRHGVAQAVDWFDDTVLAHRFYWVCRLSTWLWGEE